MLGSGVNNVIGSTGNLFVTATDGTDTITAGSGQTTIFTGSGSDTVNAGSGSLTIFTGRGTTSVAGGTGAETIIVGHGTTNATLSTGIDTLKIGWGAGTANVANFVHGIDTIDVSALHFGSYSTLVSDATITTTSSGLTIQFAHGPTINLIGVTSVSASDFTF
jgi:Ca2+-binding RTX toxin-like protein